MTKRQTRDGIKLTKIIRAAENMIGVTVREGSKHPYVLSYDNMRPCPVAASTNARTMLVPWFKEITGYSNKDIYSSLRKGKWH